GMSVLFLYFCSTIKLLFCASRGKIPATLERNRMNPQRPNTKFGLQRRTFLKAGPLAGLLSMAGRAVGIEARQNPITIENSNPGALDWQLTRVRVDGSGYRSNWIEGYCSKQSVLAGDSIDIMVSTNPPRPFRIEIFRMGYYG